MVSKPVIVKGSDTYWQERVNDAAYWRREAHQAFTERDEIKASLRTVDAAEYWRKQARDARGREENVRRRLTSAVTSARQANDALATYRQAHAAWRRALWEVFGELAEADPVKPKLWAVWQSMVLPPVETDGR